VRVGEGLDFSGAVPYIHDMECIMTHRLMSDDEKVAVTMPAIALRKAGKEE